MTKIVIEDTGGNLSVECSDDGGEEGFHVPSVLGLLQMAILHIAESAHRRGLLEDITAGLSEEEA